MTNKALLTESKMEFLDMETWERAEHFTFFQSLCTSRYGFTVQQDVTELFNYRKEQNSGSAKLDSRPYSTILQPAQQMKYLNSAPA